MRLAFDFAIGYAFMQWALKLLFYRRDVEYYMPRVAAACIALGAASMAHSYLTTPAEPADVYGKYAHMDLATGRRYHVHYPESQGTQSE